jgi:cell shape-determining protein MreD
MQTLQASDAMTEQHGAGLTIGERKVTFHTPVLSRDLSVMTASELPNAAYQIQGLIAEYCGYLAENLYFGSALQETLFARLQAARKEIDESNESRNLAVTLNKVIFEVHRIHARIAQEEKFIATRRPLRWISPSLVLVYIVIIIAIIVRGSKSNMEMAMMPVIGIPVGVLLWSLIGSVAAILHRFYTYRIKDLSQVNLEIAWLIARPLTGLIMGMVSYVFIIAGLFVLANATQSNSDVSAIRPQLLWAVAFLAGFSDRFFESFIRTLVRKLSGAAPSSRPSTNGA